MASRNSADTTRKRTPPPRIGDALPLTEDDIAALAAIHPQDIEDAQTWARKYGSRRLNALLNARPYDDETTG